MKWLFVLVLFIGCTPDQSFECEFVTGHVASMEPSTTKLGEYVVLVEFLDQVETLIIKEPAYTIGQPMEVFICNVNGKQIISIE